MKHVIFLGDGMADYPIEELGGKTPLQAANHPAMDSLAQKGILGTALTIPEGMPKGSDVANLSVFGVDPAIYYTGRSPLEAISLGIKLNDEDVTYRCNMVTLSNERDLLSKSMVDYSAGEISSEEAGQLIALLQKRFGSDLVEFYPGVSYRHCLVLRNANTGCVTTPPHDITGRRLTVENTPGGKNSIILKEIMSYSLEEFPKHPVNQNRVAQGKNPANAAWFWGEGRRPALKPFIDSYGVQGGVISAVDLIHGIGLGMGLKSIPVAGATGNFHTDFKAKGQAAIKALKEDCDFLYIHVEAPDECGHQNQLKEKVWSIEQIDQHIVAPVMEYLTTCGEEWSVLVMPDHPTPISIRTHSGDAVPFALCNSSDKGSADRRYSEIDAAETGVFVAQAYTLMDVLMGKKSL